MSHSESHSSVNYQGLALTSLVVGGIAAGIGLTNVEPAEAGENPRISVAVTNIQSNQNSQSFFAEIVAPATDYFFTQGAVSVNYATVGGASSDTSQLVITDGAFSSTPQTINSSTVEAATARAINNALTDGRYGDIVGLVNAYNGPPASAQNPSASVAITNIKSNSNSQSFAAEIVAPFANFYISRIETTAGALAYSNTITGDTSQVFLTGGGAQATFTGFTANTVDAATARAIDSLSDASRYGDVIGIVSAYGNKGFAEGAENPSVSVALTNIQSNTNSQNFAAEIVAPETGAYFSSVVATVGFVAANTADSSQRFISSGTISAASVGNTTSSVERSTARSIDNANTADRYGDVMGILKAWQGGGSPALD